MKKFIVLFMFLGLTAVFITACGEEEPPVPVAASDICTMESNSWVVVEGRMGLPSFMTCQEGKCSLRFGPNGVEVSARVRTSTRSTTNTMNVLPDQYRDEDLQLVLDDESLADVNTMLSVIGRVKRPSENVCYLDVSSMRLPGTAASQ